MNSTLIDVEENAPVIDLIGVSAIVLFYVLMILVGGWATWRFKKQKSLNSSTSSEELILAGRRLELPVAVASLSATQIGGAFLCGTAEETFRNGIFWCCVPFAFISGMVLNGLTFAKTMRRHGYVTVFDPIQETYGHVMGSICIIPHIIGDLFWIGAVLSVLGSTLSVIMGLRREISIFLSSAVGLIYTLTGGLISVAYTDVLQLFIVFIGMFLCVPFILRSDAVVKGGFAETKDWFGNVSEQQVGVYIDAILVPLLGGLPWQGYYQRALALKSPEEVLPMSLLASIPPLLLLIPPILIGGVAKTAAWNETALATQIMQEDAPIVLPLALRYLVPSAASFFGVGAITAAVISTMDSAVFGLSSALANNIYRGLLRKKASETEVVWCTRICVVIVGISATGVAFAAKSIYGLWYVSSDLNYVLIFPHFVLAMIAPKFGTAFASASSLVVGFLLRILVGESSIGLPPVIKFPETVPVRTLAMVISSAVLVFVSFIERFLKLRIGIYKSHNIENKFSSMNHINFETSKL